VWWWLPDAERHVATSGGGSICTSSSLLADPCGTIASAAHRLQYAEQLAAQVEAGSFFSSWWPWYPPPGQADLPPPARSHQWLTMAVRKEVEQARRALASAAAADSSSPNESELVTEVS
jgi:hypothetical protein